MSSWAEPNKRLAIADRMTTTLDTIHQLVDTAGQAYGGHQLGEAGLYALAIAAHATVVLDLIRATARSEQRRKR